MVTLATEFLLASSSSSTTSSSGGKNSSSNNNSKKKNKKKTAIVREDDWSEYEIQLESSANASASNSVGGDSSANAPAAASASSAIVDDTVDTVSAVVDAVDDVDTVSASASNGSGIGTSRSNSFNSTTSGSQKQQQQQQSAPAPPGVKPPPASILTSPPPPPPSTDEDEDDLLPESPISRYRREMSGDDGDGDDLPGQVVGDNGGGLFPQYNISGEEEEEEEGVEIGRELLLDGNYFLLAGEAVSGDEEEDVASSGGSDNEGGGEEEEEEKNGTAFAWPTVSSTSSSRSSASSKQQSQSSNIKKKKKKKKQKQRLQRHNRTTSLDSRIALEMEAARRIAESSVVDSDLTDEQVHHLVLQALQQYQQEGSNNGNNSNIDSESSSPSPPPTCAVVDTRTASSGDEQQQQQQQQDGDGGGTERKKEDNDDSIKVSVSPVDVKSPATVANMKSRSNSLEIMNDSQSISLVDYEEEDEDDEEDDDDDDVVLGFSPTNQSDGASSREANHQQQQPTSPSSLGLQPPLLQSNNSGDQKQLQQSEKEEEKKESSGEETSETTADGTTDNTEDGSSSEVAASKAIPPRSKDPLLQARDSGKRARFSAAMIEGASAAAAASPSTARAALSTPSPTGAGSTPLNSTISATESDVGSVDGLPLRIRARWEEGRRENVMQSLDGLRYVTSKSSGTPRKRSSGQTTSECYDAASQQIVHSKSSGDHSRHTVFTETTLPAAAEIDNKSSFDDSPLGFFSSWPLALMFGAGGSETQCSGYKEDGDDLYDGRRRNDQDETTQVKSRWRDEDDSFALLACANIIHPGVCEASRAPVPTSLVRVASELPPPLSFAEALDGVSVDPRMQTWVDNQFTLCDRPTRDGSYRLGKSRTVLVHEIVRGNWTWCTAWSPDGNRLAVATENHHLAVIDTSSSSVWRVRHDQRIKGPMRTSGGTHALRSIAWGTHYIAIGGTGNAVGILAPIEPYPVLHTIEGTGFVGSLHWKTDSSDLVIGSRLDRATVVRIKAKEDDAQIESKILHTIERKCWVDSVAFSPRGKYLAIGDAGGNLLVYNYLDERNKDEVSLDLIKSFRIDDALLEVEWSPDGQWLYVGGEDFTVTVIETRYWETVHRIRRDRWVQCLAASHGGTHVAVGGVSSEISILDVKNGWDSVMGIELNGLVPLSAKWHPTDQYLALTGQNNSILVVETTNARHVKGHHLHSLSAVLAVEFSPDGRMAVIGNKDGIITFFSLTGSTFETSYELVAPLNDRLTIQWSVNGLFIVIGCRNSVLVIGRKKDRRGSSSKVPPKSSGFCIRKVLHNLSDVHAVSIDSQCQYIAVGGKSTWILDATADFTMVREWTGGLIFAAEWSPDGRWLATIGKGKTLTIYDTSEDRVDRWRAVFSIACDYVGHALAWSPLIVGGLLYLAYAGDGKEITIMEIRMLEGTWETVLRIRRPGGFFHGLDWNTDGLLAAAISNGTVSIIDLAYLQSGVAVNEMDYNWQRQALTCFTEIRRNRGKNAMRCVRWIPSAPGSDSLLAVGGTDGEVEIVDLTERQRCRGYVTRH